MRYITYILLMLLLIPIKDAKAQKSRNKQNITKEKHEISFNALYASLGLYEVQYERLSVKHNLSYGISAGSSFNNYVFERSGPPNYLSRYKFHYGFAPFLKIYFNKKPVKGFYMKLSCYIIKYQHQYRWGFGGNPDDEILTRNYNSVLPSLSIGSKFIVYKRITIDTNIGLAYDVSKPFLTLELLVFGINLGYRF